jgi:hypothetical protein
MAFNKFLAVVLLAALACTGAYAAEARLALLIGNAAYKPAPLRTPVNDVRLMEAALKDAGFTVMKAENASLRDMRRLVRDFGDRLKTDGGVGLFYFAGHGVQVRGENFLVGADSDMRREDEVADDSLNANTILEKMQTAGNRVNLVILDASRSSPFAVKSRSAVEGLAGMRAPGGSLVAHSTAPGSVAPDGTGRNGLYAENLARTIRLPGLPVEEVFKQVRTAVRKQSNNLQNPWENMALEGQFAFNGLPTAGRPDTATMELAFWESVKSSNQPAELQAYLSQYPEGVFASLAQVRMAQLKAGGPTTASAPGVDGGLLGTLDLIDGFSKQKRKMDVRTVDTGSTRKGYSTGDMISDQGQVLQLRVGEHVLRVTGGALWTVPLQDQASGQALVEQIDIGYHARGTFRWTATPVGEGKVRVDGTVAYSSPTPLNAKPVYMYGKWTSTYSAGRDLPDSTSARLRSEIPFFTNVMATELKFR